MPQMKKLGQQLQTALALGIPAELAVLIITSSNPKRLQELFQQASIRMLNAHQDVLQRPHSSIAIQERVRSKALVDLIRARISAIGLRKPPVGKMFALMDAYPAKNVIEIRRAA